jgi:hypothetical protein
MGQNEQTIKVGLVFLITLMLVIMGILLFG